MTMEAGRVYQFGPFRLDPKEHRLLEDGKPVSLTPKVFETLCVLAGRAGQLIDKDELIQIVWRDAIVEEGNLKVNISLLRKALGEGYIETVPRRGYRFTAHVTVLDREPESAEGMAPLEPTGATHGGQATSIAVLPFTTLTVREADEYMGVGFADALITRLSNIRDVVVRPTSSVIGYAGANPDVIAAAGKLRVDWVLEGTIRRAGERVRISVQLVNGRNGVPTWAQKFDENLTDIFAVEDRISELVAAALMVQLSGDEKERLARRTTDSITASLFYWKGRHHWGKRTSSEIRKGFDYFGQAIEADPAFARAHAGLADCFTLMAWVRASPPREALPKAIAAARKALEIDPELAEAQASLAWADLQASWRWAEAEAGFQRAIRLSPHCANAHLFYGVQLIAMGRFEEAEREIGTAQEMDPLSLIVNTVSGWPHYFARRYDQAIAAYRMVLESAPRFFAANFLLGQALECNGDLEPAIAVYEQARALESGPWVSSALARAYALAGDREQARTLVGELGTQSGRVYVSPYDLAAVYAGLDETQEALRWLERAFDDWSSWLLFVNVEPRLDNLRNEPKFQRLLLRTNLPQALASATAANSGASLNRMIPRDASSKV